MINYPDGVFSNLPYELRVTFSDAQSCEMGAAIGNNTPTYRPINSPYKFNHSFIGSSNEVIDARIVVRCKNDKGQTFEDVKNFIIVPYTAPPTTPTIKSFSHGNIVQRAGGSNLADTTLWWSTEHVSQCSLNNASTNVTASVPKSGIGYPVTISNIGSTTFTLRCWQDSSNTAVRTLKIERISGGVGEIPCDNCVISPYSTEKESSVFALDLNVIDQQRFEEKTFKLDDIGSVASLTLDKLENVLIINISQSGQESYSYKVLDVFSIDNIQSVIWNEVTGELLIVSEFM